MTRHGTFCWTELLTWDVEASKRFYAALFGWTFTPSGRDDGYWFAHHQGEAVGGLFQMTEPTFSGIPSHWFSHLATDDVEASLAAAVEAGATVLRPPFRVGDLCIALIKDASGAPVGLTQVGCTRP